MPPIRQLSTRIRTTTPMRRPSSFESPRNSSVRTLHRSTSLLRVNILDNFEFTTHPRNSSLRNRSWCQVPTPVSPLNPLTISWWYLQELGLLWIEVPSLIKWQATRTWALSSNSTAKKRLSNLQGSSVDNEIKLMASAMMMARSSMIKVPSDRGTRASEGRWKYPRVCELSRRASSSQWCGANLTCTTS